MSVLVESLVEPPAPHLKHKLHKDAQNQLMENIGATIKNKHFLK